MNILMINQDQFGYKAGYYHYCKHLTAQGHSIVYLCNDHHLPKMSLDGVEVIYVDEPSSVKWRMVFLSRIKSLKKTRNIDVVLCSYFRGCSILKLVASGLPVVVDVRSGDLAKNSVKRNFYNEIIRIETALFDRIMTLSTSLARLLRFKHGSYDVVPLGSDKISEKLHRYQTINMLYVGTLQQRDIHKTIEGLARFCEKYPNADVRYDIIGFGLPEEESLIKSTIKDSGLSGKVVFHGRINYENLTPYFDNANIGVAFVPMTPYYDCQPSTKIYEYVLSGIYCVATNTYENRILIEPVNGILHDDNADAFCDALTEYYLKDKSKFSSAEIRQSMAKYEWVNVVNNMLLPVLKKVQMKK